MNLKYLLSAVAVPTKTGEWEDVSDADYLSIQVDIGGAANVDIEFSNDLGLTPVAAETGITLSGGYTHPAAWRYVRARKNSGTGVVSVVLLTRKYGQGYVR